MNPLFQVLYLIDVKPSELRKAKKCLTKLNLVMDQNENILALKNRATYFGYDSLIKVEVLNDAPIMEKVVQSCLKNLKNSMICFEIDDDEETWAYILYKDKKVYDKFSVNPFPNLAHDLEYENYYVGIDILKMLEESKADKHKIIEVFPTVSLDSISKYYDYTGDKWEYYEEKLYPEDEYCTSFGRQAFDFIKKLKLPNPTTF